MFKIKTKDYTIRIWNIIVASETERAAAWRRIDRRGQSALGLRAFRTCPRPVALAPALTSRESPLPTSSL